MKKIFVMLALAGGTMGAFAQTETDSAAVVNKGITPVKEVYSQKEEGICSFVEKKSYVYARYEKQGLYRP